MTIEAGPVDAGVPEEVTSSAPSEEVPADLASAQAREPGDVAAQVVEADEAVEADGAEEVIPASDAEAVPAADEAEEPAAALEVEEFAAAATEDEESAVEVEEAEEAEEPAPGEAEEAPAAALEVDESAAAATDDKESAVEVEEAEEAEESAPGDAEEAPAAALEIEESVAFADTEEPAVALEVEEPAIAGDGEEGPVEGVPLEAAAAIPTGEAPEPQEVPAASARGEPELTLAAAWGGPVVASSMDSITLPERSRHDADSRRHRRRRSAARLPSVVMPVDIPEDAEGRVEFVVVRAEADREESPRDGGVAPAASRDRVRDLLSLDSGWVAVGALAAALIVLFVALEFVFR
jgi:hypothetical protein